ncbi:MAG TPA: murein biosynthesis integral membrane protein MurJ [Chloroflexota bacterium]|nr:murein biosynthesis integral membrane protein MurJ [Chloroflexota bacterium]
MDRRRIATATLVIMTGTLVASFLGFVRAVVVAAVFGHTGSTDAFVAALVVPQMFYDQLIGGAIAAVLIPTFSLLATEDLDTLWRVVRAVFLLVGTVMLTVVALLEIAAHPLMSALASGFVGRGHGTLDLSVTLVRLLLPALLFMGLSAVVLATLYSLQRRAASAFAPACFHLGIIGAALVGAGRFGIEALSVGAVIGAASQLLVQLPALFRAIRGHVTHSPPLRVIVHDAFAHPVVRRILRLYVPVALGLVVSMAGQVADVNFKSHLPQAGDLTVMQYATQLIQFPVGIVVAALGFAVLPSISVDAAANRLEQFKDTLALGIRLVFVLMIPAAVGFLVLATPIVTLILQHHLFNHQGTVRTVTALLGYAPQLPFIGVDQLMIVAFYARHNTLTPALVGVLGVAVYVTSAALLLGPHGILGLAIANTIQIATHTVVLAYLLRRAIGSLTGRGLTATLLKVLVASACMAAVIGAVDRWISPAGSGLAARLLAVALPGAAALAVYGAMVLLLRVEELTLAYGLVARRLAPTPK